MGLEDIPKEIHYELLKKGKSSIRAKAQLIIDTMGKKRYYIITDEEKDEYRTRYVVQTQGFTASKARDVTGRTFIYLQEVTGPDKGKVGPTAASRSSRRQCLITCMNQSRPHCSVWRKGKRYIRIT